MFASFSFISFSRSQFEAKAWNVVEPSRRSRNVLEPDRYMERARSPSCPCSSLMREEASSIRPWASSMRASAALRSSTASKCASEARSSFSCMAFSFSSAAFASACFSAAVTAWAGVGVSVGRHSEMPKAAAPPTKARLLKGRVCSLIYSVLLGSIWCVHCKLVCVS